MLIVEKLAVLETKMTTVEEQNKIVIKKLDEIVPSVKENSWWIERIKLCFVLLAGTGLGLGVISWIWKG